MSNYMAASCETGRTRGSRRRRRIHARARADGPQTASILANIGQQNRNARHETEKFTEWLCRPRDRTILLTGTRTVNCGPRHDHDSGALNPKPVQTIRYLSLTQHAPRVRECTPSLLDGSNHSASIVKVNARLAYRGGWRSIVRAVTPLEYL